MEIIIRDTDGLEQAAREFLAALGDRRIVAFHAPMGAGKTTFISALCRVLGLEDEATSPTFSIINEYHSPAGEKVCHFDFYRIDDLEEAADLGLDDYFCSGNLCLMEWPENVEPLLPDDTLDVEIRINPDSSRTLRLD